MRSARVLLCFFSMYSVLLAQAVLNIASNISGQRRQIPVGTAVADKCDDIDLITGVYDGRSEYTRP
jgi:hypothetical protein